MDEHFVLTKQEDEHLGSYWNCLKGKSQMRWLAKELYQRENMGLNQLDDYALEKLRTSKRCEHFILNTTINYDILDNLRYSDSFFYIHLDSRVENPTSDFVSNSLYLE